MDNVCEHLSTSLAVLHLHPDYISASPSHSLAKRKSVLATRSTKEQAPNIAQGWKASPSVNQCLKKKWEASLHHCQLLTVYASWYIPVRCMQLLTYVPTSYLLRLSTPVKAFKSCENIPESSSPTAQLICRWPSLRQLEYTVASCYILSFWVRISLRAGILNLVKIIGLVLCARVRILKAPIKG